MKKNLRKKIYGFEIIKNFINEDKEYSILDLGCGKIPFFLEFKKDSKDTRVRHIYLSSKGSKIYNEIFFSQKKRIYKAFLNSSAKEVLNFDQVLKRIINEKL